MAIKIAVSDADGDGKGINFTAYLKNFAATYSDATGRGNFSGKTSGDITDPDDPVGAGAYVTTDSEEDGGNSVIFNASGKFTYDFFSGHVVSGKLQSIVFGTDTVASDISGGDVEYSNSGDITISGFKKNYQTSTADGEIMGDILKVDENGLDSLYAFLRSDSIVFKGSTGSDTFTGYNHADRLKGGAGSDRLNGAGGNDKLDGDTGNDKLTGGKGADTFHFASGDGKDTVTDFVAGNKGKDVIEFAHGVFSNFQDVLDHASAVSGGVEISYGSGDTLILSGVKLSSLVAGDFHLL